MTADTDERQQLHSTSRGFFEKHSGEEAVRFTMETPSGYDRALWELMAGQLGLQGLLIPEEFGGSAFGFTDMQIVLEEMGRALVCAPFLSSAVLAVRALLASGDDDRCADLLPGIAGGTSIVALAFTNRQGQWDPEDGAVTAHERSGGWTLQGKRWFVLDAAGADVVLVAATTARGPALFAVDGRAGGVSTTALQTLDMTRRLANIVFEDATAAPVGEPGQADACLRQAFDAGLAALAAEQLGGARKVMEMAVEYAKIREQFGRPIGSFQAIKHKCADMLVEVESATAAAYAAGAAIDESSHEAGLLASLAKSYCSEAYCHAAAENIQIHGGIGFTWEHPAHLYFRRAKSSEMLLGTPTYHRERMLKELGL